MTTRVVILGTGTNVGKSYVTAALARALALSRPHDAVGAMKPIETGFAAGGSSDAATLSALFHNAPPPQTHPRYSYADPLTPYLAAQRAGGPEIDVGEVARWVAEWEARARRSVGGPASSEGAAAYAAPRPTWALIESAGGAFSPIAAAEGHAVTNVDLWRALEPCAAVLVARDGLGTLHDVAATLAALAAHHRKPDHLVLSAAGPRDLSRGTNAGVLRALRVAEPTAVLGDEATELTQLAEALIRAAGLPR